MRNRQNIRMVILLHHVGQRFSHPLRHIIRIFPSEWHKERHDFLRLFRFEHLPLSFEEAIIDFLQSFQTCIGHAGDQFQRIAGPFRCGTVGMIEADAFRSEIIPHGLSLFDAPFRQRRVAPALNLSLGIEQSLAVTDQI